MPGRRWTVWGRMVGVEIYGPSEPVMRCERSYSTAELEAVLVRAGLRVA